MFLAIEPPEETNGVHTKRFGHNAELDDIQAPFSALILGHERLRPLETVGKLRLREASPPAGLDEQFPESPMRLLTVSIRQ